MRRRPAVTAVCSGAALAGLVVASVTHRDLERTRAELAATDATLAAETDQRRAAVRDRRAADERLTATVGALGRARQSARATRVELDTRGREADGLEATLTVATATRNEARGSLRSARTSAWTRGQHIATLQRCLAGVSRATAHRRAGRRPESVLVLQSVSADCLAAQHLVSAGEPSPPVFPFNFGDPFVLRAADGYWAYATNGGSGNVQLVRSLDLLTWQWVGDVLPTLPSWATPHRTWAPSVLRRGDRYVLYYTATERASGRQCISFATASQPRGPFADRSARPFLCQRQLGGSIDPSPFVAGDGRSYLVWKSDGEAVGGRAHLWSQPLTPDGLSLTGRPSPLIGPNQAWERRTVEGPSMVQDGGDYYLLYSANSWNTRDYAVGFARCATPTGPCRKPTHGPILRSHGSIAGPGGQEVLRDRHGQLWLSFHAWTEPYIGYPNRRTLRFLRLGFGFGRPVISGR